jgi:NAD(P)-dependent dehydrogenase (short-subunit alcohol dehydrogenase family)
MRFDESVAIVTGGARGIGRACAVDLAAEGALVVVADVDVEAGERVAAEVGGIFVRCDVSRTEDAENLIRAAAQNGRLDIIVNAAGINHKAGLWDTTEADWDRVLNVDLKGTFLVAQAGARQMVEAGTAGVIVNFSSITAAIALSDQIPYCAAKGGVTQLTKSLALSLAPHGIRVNAVAPGPVMTELMEVVVHDEAKRAELLERMPLGRIAEPKEIARVVSFLASPDASFITGQTIYVDGGRTIQAFPRRMEL